MSEVNKASTDGSAVVSRSQSANGVPASKLGTPINEEGQVFGPEGDKERNITKAALSIAEICALPSRGSGVPLSFRRRLGRSSRRANR